MTNVFCWNGLENCLHSFYVMYFTGFNQSMSATSLYFKNEYSRCPKRIKKNLFFMKKLVIIYPLIRRRGQVNKEFVLERET